MADILACQSRNNTGPSNNVNDGSKPLSIQESQVSEWVSEHEQYQSPGASSTKCNEAIIKVRNYTRGCQNVCQEKGLSSNKQYSRIKGE